MPPHRFRCDLTGIVNLAALVIQLFLVSRIVDKLGVKYALYSFRHSWCDRALRRLT